MDSEGIKAFQEIIDRSRRIVFFGGAGVSTASGIPDFRSAEGLYAEEADGISPEMILSKSFFYLEPEKFFDWYRKHTRPTGSFLSWNGRTNCGGL